MKGAFRIISRIAQLLDVSITNPLAGHVLKYNATTQKWENGAGGSGGASDFLALTDTPDSYAGQKGKAVIVNDTENGVTFGTVSGGGALTVSPGVSTRTTTTEFIYASNGDANGIFYYIGSKGGFWTNPHTDGRVLVVMSSTNVGSPSMIVNRASAENVHTNDTPGSWIGFDFGKGRSVLPKKYSLQNRNVDASNLIRNWKLQGTNGPIGDSTSVTDWANATWTDLDTRTNDTTITTASGWGTFTVPTLGNSYRYLRILATGPNSNNQNFLIVAEAEFYGTLTETESLTTLVDNTPLQPTTGRLAVREWSSDGDSNGVFYFMGQGFNALNTWTNPFTLGTLSITGNPDYNNAQYSNKSALVNRVGSLWLTDGVGGANAQFLIFDLGAGNSLTMSRYTVRNRVDTLSGNTNNWKLEASNDCINWVHVNSQTNYNWTALSQWASIPVGSGGSYRYWRIAQTGKNNAGGDNMVFGEVEFYGKLTYGMVSSATVTQTKNLAYASAGDANGVFYFLGTDKGKGGLWSLTNLLSNTQVVPSTSPNLPGTPDYTFINRTADNNNTGNVANSWVAFDLGQGCSLVVNKYTIQNRRDFATESLRNWKLQGSNNVASLDVAGYAAAPWEDIDTRTADTSLSSSQQWGTFAVTNTKGYRWLRILQTGTNSSGSNYLCFGEIEFYGTYTYTDAVQVLTDRSVVAVTATDYNPDIPPASAHVSDDEWNDSETLPGGKRQKWAWVNQANASVSLVNETLRFYASSPMIAGWNNNCLLQPITNQAGDWEYSTKVHVDSNTLPGSYVNCLRGGLIVRNSVNGRQMTLALQRHSTYGNPGLTIIKAYGTSPTTYSSGETGQYLGAGETTAYLRLKKKGTNILTYYSLNGIDWFYVDTSDIAAFLQSADQIGIFVDSENTTNQCVSTFYWFRETSKDTQAPNTMYALGTATGTPVASNIKSVTKTNTQSTSAYWDGTDASWVNVSGLSVTITPTSPASSVQVNARVMAAGVPSMNSAMVRVVRDGVPIGVGDKAGARNSVSGSAYSTDSAQMTEIVLNVVDTPATTNPVTYTVQFVASHLAAQSQQVAYINRSSVWSDVSNNPSVASSLTAEEKIMVVTGGTAVADRYAPSVPMGSLVRAYTFESGVEGWTSSGTLTASGGSLAFTASGSQVALEPSSATNVADGEIQCVLKRSGTSFAVVFRATDTNNFYMFDASNSAAPSIYKCVAGSFTSLGSGGSTVQDGKDYVFTVRFVGSQMEAYVNGAHVVTVTDTSFSAGRVGLRNTNATATVKEFRVFSLANGLQPNASGQGSVAGAAYIGAMQQIAEVVLTADASEIVFDNIPQTYRDLVFSINARSTRIETWDEVKIQLNGDTTDTNYLSSLGFDGASGGGNNYTYGLVGTTSASNDTPIQAAASIVTTLHNYSRSDWHKTWEGLNCSNRGNAGQWTMTCAGQWKNTSPVSKARLVMHFGGSFKAGSVVALYGIGGFNTTEAFTPDTGGGGRPGLVPAPEPGDAAAKRVLCANGDFIDVATFVPYLASNPRFGKLCTIWIDASDKDYHMADVNGNINAVFDKGKRAQLFTKPGGTIAYGANQNNKSTFEFSNSGRLQAAAFVSGNVPFCAFIAFVPKSLNGVPFCVGADAGNAVFHTFTKSAGLSASMESFRSEALTGAYTLGQPYVFAVRYDGATNKVWLNGVAGSSAALVNIAVSTSMTSIGTYFTSTSALNMTFFEMLGSLMAPTDAEMVAVSQELMSKWGIA